MKFLKNLFAFYINSSIHVSLAVVALVFVTAAEFGFSISENLLFFIFFGSITAYNFVKYAGVARLHHRSLAKWLKLIQIFSFICFGLFIYFLFQISFETLLLAAFFGLLTLFYALPIFPKQKNLRSFGGLKIFIIAVVWAGVTVILPSFDAGMDLRLNIWLEFVQRMLFVLVLMIPFEIRDLKYDDSLLKTLPQKHGIFKTKKIGFVLLLACLILEVLQNSGILIFLAFLAVSILSVFLILKSSVAQRKYYASFWVEALPILWLIFILLLRFDVFS